MKKDGLPHDRKIREAAERLTMDEGPALDPGILFLHASEDDMAAYDPDLLALACRHAGQELAGFDWKYPRVTCRMLEGTEAGGNPLHILSVTARNMPFLYDSVMGEITASHRDIAMAVHPILVMEPGQPPRAYLAEEKSRPEHRISHIQIHLGHVSPSETADIVERVRTVLKHVQLSVTDWQPMLSLLDRAITELKTQQASKRTGEREEALAFLAWLRSNNFTFLGMREYELSGDGDGARVERADGAGLGILSDPDILVLRLGKDAVTTTPEILAFLQGPDTLIVTKANAKSLVHRRAYLDYIGIKRFGADGKVIGELRIVGLFTSSAYTKPASEIPLLRLKVKKVNDHFGFDPESHSGKTLLNTLDSYPRDDLFQIDVPLLTRFCEQINELGERPRIRVLPRIDRFDRFVSVLVYVPKDLYDSDVRERTGAYLRAAFDGHISAYYPAFPEGGVARVHFIIGRRGGKTPRVQQSRLEAEIRAIATRWTDRFALLSGPDGPSLTTGQAYQESFSPEEAIADLSHMIACKNSDDIALAFGRKKGSEDRLLQLKIFHASSALALSKRVPMLENFGFNVISETTHDIGVSLLKAEGYLVVLHDMEITLRDGQMKNPDAEAARIEAALLSAWRGEVDNDGFNRLVTSAGMMASEANVLRAYARYLRQTGITYSQAYMADTLNRHAGIAVDLYKLFVARFDPELDASRRDSLGKAAIKRIETALAAVPSLDEDKIIRRFANAIQATLRTNHFAGHDARKDGVVLALKLDSRQLDGLPEPRPYREIFVYGTEVEGVHLRFGPVARGGLRWSDRAEDYRTEVLGLVKAQQVKNAVIVPVGAKGGFLPKKLPAGGSREAIFAAGTEAYKTYVRTLLSVTDNIVGNGIEPPARMIRHDGDDPYFVVAADKGTATFSDTANGLSQAAGFWLDDAFASGGSAGYDHKKMGITARGGWEAVKRHFREMGTDIQTTPFTVAGIGDMSGDVFGNGMLLSPAIRLVAAFDHRDIIIDPDPDPATGLAERQRLFTLPRSSWQDYDRSLLSRGGMIISRSEKSVRLTPEAQAAIGLEIQVAAPTDIMTAILKAPVDLLWFGGIGTYIKAPDETDADVGDRANDAIRVNGADVRAKVIGEGANLGVTQKGRIAYALSGGRLNSDAIDNSAGVNSSDVEVNIKIALAPAMKDGRLPRDKRNKLLAAMTSEVASLVLDNNYQQTLAISLVERRGRDNGGDLGRLMNALTASGLLNRRVEALPDNRTLAARYQSGAFLTRPEIGVLLSWAKIALFDQVIASDLPDEPLFEHELFGYFPKKMLKDFKADIASHRLRREIITTILANQIVNHGGPAFVTVIAEDTGASPADVARAAILVRDVFALPQLWAGINVLDGTVDGSQQNALHAQVQDFFRAATRMVLKTGAAHGPLAEAIRSLSEVRRVVRSGLPTGQAPLVADGPAAELAQQVSRLSGEIILPEIALVARQSGEAPAMVAPVFLGVGDLLAIDRLEQVARNFSAADADEARLVARIEDDMAASQRSLAAAVIRAHGRERKPVEAWKLAGGTLVSDAVLQLRRLALDSEPTLARLALSANLLSDLERATAK